MMIFIMASGLTLVFGLMDIINFGHGAFISLGAFVGVSVLFALPGWTDAASLPLNIAAILLAILAAMLLTGALSWVFERVLIRPVYGSHLKQVLITVGALIVLEEAIHVIWGGEEIFLIRPSELRGAITFAGAALEKYRILAVVLGLAIFFALRVVLRRTKIGLIVRAGVENPDMVEALGYRLKLVFIGVFIAGSALAGLGGVMWALYEQVITAGMGENMMVLIFIVVIIGGLGSVEGAFVGALLVGLLQNYVAFLEPKLALISNIALMTASQLVKLYRAGKLSPVEATRAALDRIERYNTHLNAFNLIAAESALASAAKSEERWRLGAPRGPLDGVPTSIKDVLLTKGWPTLRGSKAVPRDQAWDEDAPAVARLREHGAVLIGKTTTPEFGWKGITDSPLDGITRNPWNPKTTPGGSSGGAAARMGAAPGSGVASPAEPKGA